MQTWQTKKTAFRARKVIGTSEKWALGRESRHGTMLTPPCIVVPREKVDGILKRANHSFTNCVHVVLW